MHGFHALVLSFVLAGIACAQTYPKAEVFAGYSYLSVDANKGLRESTNGFDVSASGSFNRWFAVEAEFSGFLEHLADGGGTAGLYSYMAGPRFNLVHSRIANPLFVHSLLGFQHLTGSDFGVPVSNTAMAAALGAGVEQKLSTHWAIRSSADYVFARYFTSQNDIRVAVGFTYSFGTTTGNTGAKSRTRN